MQLFCENRSAADHYERRKLILFLTEQPIHLSSIIPRPRSRPKLRRRKHLFHPEGAAVPEVLPIVDMLQEDLEQPEAARADYHGVAGYRAVGGIVEPYISDGR